VSEKCFGTDDPGGCTSTRISLGSLPGLEDEAMKNKLVHWAKCWMYERGHPAVKMEIPVNISPRTFVIVMRWDREPYETAAVAGQI
jgi:hypothetical protein